ncbi:MAG TPA: hypothetical protein VJ874_01150 [Candidatus Thermoplasmatota archaeon]|nr:hypothetical protein [Candidatus Thermoplasmatota archaeon]
MPEATWTVVDCGCRFRRNEERFEIQPCRPACHTFVFTQEESARQGKPIRYEYRDIELAQDEEEA